MNLTIRALVLGGAILTSLPAGGDEGPGPLVVLDVPYLAQSEALCGGAAAAMVLRYWGTPDVQPADFAPLLDGDRGISTGKLAEAIASRGYDVHPVRAEGADLAREIAAGRPVLALLDVGAGLLHYVVVIGWASGRVLLHDPSVGPYRVLSQPSFLAAWRATHGFALLVRPDETSVRALAAPAPAPRTDRADVVPPAARPGPCDALLDGAVLVGRGADPEAAVPALVAATEMCPTDARGLRALAGVRFRQKRWREAADVALRAARLEPAEAESWRLLAASRFLAEERPEALEAWNRIGEPRMDRLQIEGLARTRQDVATAVAGLPPRAVLTADSLALAERRLAQLPSATNARVTYRPLAGGRADVVASVAEPGLVDPLPTLALRAGTEALARREARLRINSPTGGGESLEIGGRFAARRPAAWAELATPRMLGLGGVVSLNGLWDRQTYGFGPDDPRVPASETRRRVGLDWSGWRTASLRTDVGFAIDHFQDRAAYLSIRGGAERRLARDRVAILGDLSGWAPLGHGPGFGEFGGTLAMRSSTSVRRWVTARLDGRGATSGAPLAVWPGAGTGTGRPSLLRASPLLREGVVVGDAFGRGLLHATVEVGREGLGLGPAGLGLAAFVDSVRVWERPGQPRGAASLTAIGAGLRLRMPSAAILRLDAATRPGKGGLVLSAGWLAPWPH